MDAYRKGLNAKQAECAVKKYKRHRIIPHNILEELFVIMNKYFGCIIFLKMHYICTYGPGEFGTFGHMTFICS